jgi:hypothetical protein
LEVKKVLAVEWLKKGDTNDEEKTVNRHFAIMVVLY